MGSGTTIEGSAAALAAVPAFDPLEPRRDPTLRNVVAISALLHVLLLMLFWDQVIGAVFEKDDLVTVQMMDEPQPEKPQRKVIAQRIIDTRVRKFNEIRQQAIVEFRPELLDQMQKVVVDPLDQIEAPKFIEQRRIVTTRVNAFAEQPISAPKISVAKSAPTVRRPVVTARSAGGPRRIEAAGPEHDPRAVNVDAPLVAKGVISRQAVEGATDGAKIRALESGTSDRFLHGRGERGDFWGGELDCMKDPVCLEYLKMIRDRVYARWRIPPETDAGAVLLAFRIDRGGAAHGIVLRRSDDATLGKTCESAFRHASPFPPPPEKIRYIVNKGLVATFSYGD